MMRIDVRKTKAEADLLVTKMTALGFVSNAQVANVVATYFFDDPVGHVANTSDGADLHVVVTSGTTNF